jgi:hypothetical protein
MPVFRFLAPPTESKSRCCWTKGVDAYEKEGPKFMQRLLAKQKTSVLREYTLQTAASVDSSRITGNLDIIRQWKGCRQTAQSHPIRSNVLQVIITPTRGPYLWLQTRSI